MLCSGLKCLSHGTSVTRSPPALISSGNNSIQVSRMWSSKLCMTAEHNFQLWLAGWSRVFMVY